MLMTAPPWTDPANRRIYPVYEQSPSRSLGIDVETEDFRFSVNRSE